MGADELVDLVDADDKPVGKATLRRCLREGLRHRAVAVLVVRNDGTVLLQIRSTKDFWHPGRLTLSCTGHVGSGESYEEAARRELEEELGLFSPVVPLTKVFLPKIRSRGSVEAEVVTLFISRTTAPVRVDPVELEGVKTVSRIELLRLMKGRMLTQDAKILLKDYLSSIQE